MSSNSDSTEAAGRSGFAGGRPADRPRRSLSQRAKWPLLGAIVVVAVAAIVLLAVWSPSDAEEPAVPSTTASELVVPSSATSTVGERAATGISKYSDDPAGDAASGSSITVYDVPLPDAESAWAEIAADAPMDSARRYSDEELGLYELIDEIVFFRPYFAQGRTLDEVADRRGELWDYAHYEATGHERARLLFEFDIESAVLIAFRDLPTDLGEGGSLVQAYYEWMTHCVADAGFPDVVLDPDTQHEVPIYEAEDEQLEAYESATRFTRDEFYDLRFDCALRAASFPTLDPERRDEMLRRVRTYYLQAVYNHLRYPDVVEVPVEE